MCCFDFYFCLLFININFEFEIYDRKIINKMLRSLFLVLLLIHATFAARKLPLQNLPKYKWSTLSGW